VSEIEVIESSMSRVFKSRGFRKRGRNWFRGTSADEYQVVNLQMSSWGSGDCFLNLGWDPELPDTGFRRESQCCVSMRAEQTDVKSMRAEQTDVIPPILRVRPDGITTTELPGIVLLDSETYGAMSPQQLTEDIAAVIAVPIADLMDRTSSVLGLLPILVEKPWIASRSLRAYLASRGHELPPSR